MLGVEWDQMSQPTFSKGRKSLSVVLLPLGSLTDFVTAHESHGVGPVGRLRLMPVVIFSILSSLSVEMWPKRLCHSGLGICLVGGTAAAIATSDSLR